MVSLIAKKKVFLSLVIVLVFLFSTVAAYAATVLFTNLFGVEPVFWGRGGATYLSRIAQDYTPAENQTVCVVKHQVRENGSSGSVILRIYKGGGFPESGVFITERSLAALSLPTSGYATFDFDPCVALEGGEKYYFVWDLSDPGSAGYRSKYSNTNQFDNTAYWQFQGAAFVGGGGWVRYSNREWSFRLEGPDAKEPVIIVPGIMGSRLNRVSDGEEVWPNISEMIRVNNGQDAYLNELQLDFSGQELPAQIMDSPEVIEEELVLGFSQVIYGNLINSFRNQGYIEDLDLFTVPYDWRFDISENVSELQGVIDQALSNSFTGKVNIIAHSMGGILVKEYLRQFPEVADDINKLVFAGVPQLGAPKAFKALNYGDNMGFQIGPIDILSPERIKIITQNMPGVYQLLPSRKYIDLAGGYIKDFRESGKILSYDETKIFMTSDSELPDYRNLALLDLADNFHQTQDNQSMDVTEVHNIVGCQHSETIGSIRLYPNNEIDITAINGDGTVPVISAMNNSGGFTNYFALNSEIKANHSDLVRTESLVGLIADIVKGDPVSLPVGVSLSSADCLATPPDPTKIIFSTHSPVELHVYDSLNRHTGSLPDGDIELGISESDYFKIGENSFAFVPADGTYRVFVDAIGVGEFDLKIKSYHGSAIGEIATYLDVPIINGDLTAELLFSGFDESLVLNVDEDGDGGVDTSLLPSSVLSGEESGDVIPPEINIISPENKDYPRPNIISVNISVTDDESGIASTKIKLDGEALDSDAIDSFYEELGEHNLSVRVYDNAGNLSLGSVDFRVIATISGAIFDLERAYQEGWIPRRSIKNSLSNDLKRADILLGIARNFENHPNINPALTKQFAKAKDNVEKALRGFLKKIKRHYNRGDINKQALDVLNEDVNWILNNL